MNLKVWMLTMAAASVAAQSGSGSSPSATVAPLSPTTLASRPGICQSTKDCDKYGTGYTCVAVKTNIPQVNTAMQCVKGQVCGGNQAGACPTFASWPSNFRPVQPVCAFVQVDNCNAAMDASGNVVQVRALREEAAKPGNVTCFATTFVNEEGSKKAVNGIYQCVDKQLYVANNYGTLDFTDKQMKSCSGNITQSKGVAVTTGLCNAHGTCAPKSQFSPDFGCICAKGYSPNDNCFNATSDVCDSFGQCGLGNCDSKTGKCVCPPGSKGPQCNLCDPTYTADPTKICAGNGKCGVDGTCQCNDGYIGDNCALKPAKTNAPKSNSTDSSSSAAKPSSAVARDASIAVFGAATLLAAAMI